MSEYPHMMYRPGSQLIGIWGKHDVDFTNAVDAKHEAELRADGWTRRPDRSDAVEAPKRAKLAKVAE